MNMIDSDILVFIVTGVIVGVVVLLLIALELGKQANLTFPGRLALVGGLGFGVISFTIKAGLVLYLGSLSRDDVAGIRSLKPPIASPQIVVQSATALDQREKPRTFWDWQALPTHVRAPADNSPTPEKVALGKKLFFDKRLSMDDSLSCASCHILAEGGDDNQKFSTGIHAQKGNRNAPTVWNAAFLSRLFWDGRASSLEDQARGPLVNPVEMGMPSLKAVELKLASIPSYRGAFKRVFGGPEPVKIDHIAKAIAAYERTLITPDTPYDRFVRGDDSALTRQQIRGMALFRATGCRNCHIDPTFSSAGLVKPFGIYRPFPIHANNRFVKKYDLLVDGKRQKYRVPSLRNVALTAPYFHNGSVSSLEEAIRVMVTSQLGKTLSERSQDDISVTWSKGKVRRMTLSFNHALSEGEISDIAAFLNSLSASAPTLN